ncbi:MAG: DUF6152 family protein [Candidatus Rariloculaceae bacterium]
MRRVLAVLLTISSTLFGASAYSHHTFAVEYERTETVTIEAVVTGVHFENPHVRLDLLVSSGEVDQQQWVANSIGPGSLARRGWLRDTVKVGDRLTLYGNLGSFGAKRLWIQTMTLEDGVEIYPVGRVPESEDG